MARKSLRRLLPCHSFGCCPVIGQDFDYHYVKDFRNLLRTGEGGPSWADRPGTRGRLGVRVRDVARAGVRARMRAGWPPVSHSEASPGHSCLRLGQSDGHRLLRQAQIAGWHAGCSFRHCREASDSRGRLPSLPRKAYALE
jgi:hypothetical protein